MRKMLNIAQILAIVGYGYYVYIMIFQPPSDPLDIAHLKMRIAIVGFIIFTLQFIRSKVRDKAKKQNDLDLDNK